MNNKQMKIISVFLKDKMGVKNRYDTVENTIHCPDPYFEFVLTPDSWHYRHSTGASDPSAPVPYRSVEAYMKKVTMPSHFEAPGISDFNAFWHAAFREEKPVTVSYPILALCGDDGKKMEFMGKTAFSDGDAEDFRNDMNNAQNHT